jgi:hypothetical protein
VLELVVKKVLMEEIVLSSLIVLRRVIGALYLCHVPTPVSLH